MPKHKGRKTFNLFFLTLEIFENALFDAVKQKTKAERLAYYLYLKDRCEREIDIVFMKNDKNKTFKLLDAIDKSKEGDK